MAHYRRIAKTLHILRLAVDPGCRRQIRAWANLQEGPTSSPRPARKIFRGRAAQLYQNYHEGVHDQLGALGPVLNALVLAVGRRVPSLPYIDGIPANPHLRERLTTARTVLDVGENAVTLTAANAVYECAPEAEAWCARWSTAAPRTGQRSLMRHA